MSNAVVATVDVSPRTSAGYAYVLMHARPTAVRVARNSTNAASMTAQPLTKLELKIGDPTATTVSFTLSNEWPDVSIASLSSVEHVSSCHPSRFLVTIRLSFATARSTGQATSSANDVVISRFSAASPTSCLALSKFACVLCCASCGQQLSRTEMTYLAAPSQAWSEMSDTLVCHQEHEPALRINTTPAEGRVLGYASHLVALVKDLQCIATQARVDPNIRPNDKDLQDKRVECSRCHFVLGSASNVTEAPPSSQSSSATSDAQASLRTGCVRVVKIERTASMPVAHELKPVSLSGLSFAIDPRLATSTIMHQLFERIAAFSCRRFLLQEDKAVVGNPAFVLLWVLSDRVLTGSTISLTDPQQAEIPCRYGTKLLFRHWLEAAADEARELAHSWSQDVTVDVVETPRQLLEGLVAALETAALAFPPSLRSAKVPATDTTMRQCVLED